MKQLMRMTDTYTTASLQGGVANIVLPVHFTVMADNQPVVQAVGTLAPAPDTTLPSVPFITINNQAAVGATDPTANGSHLIGSFTISI